MKKIYTLSLAMLIAIVLGVTSCEEVQTVEPVANTTSTGLTASFLFINASPDAPSLDFFVNNLKIGPSLPSGSGQQGAVVAPITTNNIGANTNFRGKATSGTIGGVLGSADLVFRAGNNNANNFQASAGVNYTLLAVDSLNRPAPVRTLNANNFGDATWYNAANGQQISIDQYNALSSAAKARCVQIGVVPLGSTDPGGVRFLLLSDAYPTFASGNNSQAAIRFINASPTAPLTPIWVRLRPASGTTISLATNSSTHIMGFPWVISNANNPSVGSRSLNTTAPNGGTGTLAFPLQTIASAGTPFSYTLEIATNATFTPVASSVASVTFTVGKVYTIVVTGMAGKTDARGLKAIIVQHN